MNMSTCAAVTYRASDGDRDLAIQLAIAPEQATLEDAWERLTAAFGAIDPRSIEIEIRPRRVSPAAPLGRGECGRVLPMHWVQSLDAC